MTEQKFTPRLNRRQLLAAGAALPLFSITEPIVIAPATSHTMRPRIANTAIVSTTYASITTALSAFARTRS